MIRRNIDKEYENNLPHIITIVRDVNGTMDFFWDVTIEKWNGKKHTGFIVDDKPVLDFLKSYNNYVGTIKYIPPVEKIVKTKNG